MRDEILPVPIAGTVQTPERDVDLHAVRPADSARAAAHAAVAMSRWLDPTTGRLVGAAPDYVHRAYKDRRFCEVIRDAKAAGATPPTAQEFFSDPSRWG